MASPIIQIRRSAVAGKIPTTAQLSSGEFAINTYDGKVYIEQDQGGVGVGTTVIVINPWSVGTGTNTYNTYFTAGNVGIASTLPTSKLDVVGDIKVSGATTTNTLSIGSTQVISSARQLQNITSLDATTTATIESAISNAPNTFNDLRVTGVSTLGVTSISSLIVSGLSTFSGTVSAAATIGIGTIIRIVPYDTLNSGTLSFEGSAGQLLSITNNLTSGSIFAVNDVSGIPSIDVNADGTISFGAYGGNIGVGTTSPTSKLTVLGDVRITGIATATTFSGQISAGVGTITTLNGTTVSYTTGNIVTGIITTISGTNINYTGVGTITTFNASSSSVTNRTGTNINLSGVGTVGSLNIGSTSVISSGRQLQNISSLDATTTATIESAISAAPNNFNDLNVTGISTFTNGPVLIGSGTSTGTASQRLQVTGGGYISGNLGVGSITPTSLLTVQGDALIVGFATANSFRARGGAPGAFGTNGNGYGFFGSGDNDGGMYSSADGQIEFYSNSQEVARFTANQNFLIGSVTETGTISQKLQVTSGAYVSGNLGLGNTLPTSRLSVIGDGNFSGVVTATTFVGNLSGYASTAGISTYAINAGVATSVIGGIGSITSLSVSGISTISIFNVGTGGTIITTTNSGFVGIGTTNPTSKLTIGGPIQIQQDSGSNNRLIFRGQSGSPYRWNIDNYGSNNEFRIFREDDLTTANGVAIVSISTTGTLSSTKFSGDGSLLTNVTSAGYASNAGVATYATSSGIASALTSTASVNTTGIITTSQLSTGASGIGINITTNTISGPSSLIIDPAAVNDNTGSVRIKGDLYVDGSQFIVNSTTIELADFNVGIATTIGTNALLDGAGIGIGSTSIRKTITWNNTANALTSSEDWNLISGKQYEINGVSVLSSTTLGSGIINSSLTSVGTLSQLNVSGISTFSGISTHSATIFGTQASFVGVVTASNFSGNASSATYSNTAGVSTYATTSGVSTSVSGGTANVTSLTLPNSLFSSGVTTTSSTSEVSIDSFDLNTYRSAKYQVQITRGSEYEITEIFIVHDNTNSYGTEYATVRTGSILSSFNTDILSGNVRLLATPSSASSTTFKLVRTLIQI